MSYKKQFDAGADTFLNCPSLLRIWVRREGRRYGLISVLINDIDE